jgi:phosphodiesterase/alkaline phosphatase D-like protein
MYGATMGTLNVYTRSGGILGSAIWTMTGNKGNKWLKAQVSVTRQATWQVMQDRTTVKSC